jgi:ribosomal protein S18 acetylase RimI-like enzyme
MGTMLTIAEAGSAADLDAVRELWSEYGAATDASGAFAQALAAQDFAGELASLPGVYAPPSGCLLLARLGEEPVGCVAFRSLDAWACEMKRLYVRPAHRHCGVGRMLAEAAIRTAAVAGYSRMRLDTLPSMKTAQALYRALGFRDTQAYHDKAVPGSVFLEREIA